MKYTTTHMIMIDLDSNAMLQLPYTDTTDVKVACRQVEHIRDLFERIAPKSKYAGISDVRKDENGKEVLIPYRDGDTVFSSFQIWKKMATIARLPVLFFQAQTINDAHEDNSILITPDMSLEEFESRYYKINPPADEPKTPHL